MIPPRPPNSSGGNPGSSDPRRRSHTDDVDDDADLDDFDNFEETPPSSTGRRTAAPEVDPDEAFFEDKPDQSRAEETTSSPRSGASGRSTSTRNSAGEGAPAKGFFESLEAGLRSAGQTAERYTRMGVARAEMEKLRYDLKGAHAILGELAMRCWSDAPDLGLTSQDPAVADAVKKVKALRLKIREKQAKIAELKRVS